MSTDLLAVQMHYNQYTVMRNTEGLSHDESLVRPQPGGNCANWVLGHVMDARNKTLELVGKESLWKDGEGEVYARGSEPLTDGAKALPLERLLADFDRSQGEILEGLMQLTPEQLAAKAPFSPAHRDDETVGSLLAGLVFHESYHLGQLGLLRRLVGKPGALS